MEGDMNIIQSVWGWIVARVTEVWRGVKTVLSRLFGSRKMIINLVGLVVLAIGATNPDQAQRAIDWGTLIVAALFLGGFNIALEDGLKAFAAERPKTVVEGVGNIISEVVTPPAPAPIIPAPAGLEG
jgi:di/tricarboxylate transporter